MTGLLIAGGALAAIMGAGTAACCAVTVARLRRGGAPAVEVKPPPATPAARRQLTEAFATAESAGLWSRPARKPDSPLTGARAGSPEAAVELLDGIADVLTAEAASAAVRGDEHVARTLLWLEDFTRDARDGIAR